MMKFLTGNRRSRLALPGLILVVTIILLWHIVRDLVAAGAGIESPTISTFASRLSLVLFFSVIVIAQVGHFRQDQKITNREAKTIHCRAWIAGFAGAFVLIAGLIILVDPQGLYGTSLLEPRVMLFRDDKVDAYKRLDDTPDVIVLGSSRAFTVWPEFIQQDFGYSAFNMSVEAGRMEDYVIQTKFILDRDPKNPPKVLLIEITAPLLASAAQVARRSPLDLFPYMDAEIRKLAIQTRIEGLLDLQMLNEAIYSLRYYASDPAQPADWVFGPDGGGDIEPSGNLHAVLQMTIENGSAPRCAHGKLDPEGIRRLEQVVRLAEEHHLSLIFYTTPRHPDFYDRIMVGSRRYQRCELALHTYMNDLTSRYPFVFFLDYPRLEDIGGASDDTGYYDYDHMTALNNHYLVQAAAGTIRQAYTVAVQQRASD